MNFFEAQKRARRKTGLLVLLFALAVAVLTAVVNIVVLAIVTLFGLGDIPSWSGLFHYVTWPGIAAISAAVLLVVAAGSIFKMSFLSQGGRVVAEALGGTRIGHSAAGLKQRTLLNVVEEMAVACGTPAPPVYLLTEETGINACSAGTSPRDAVICVTQGAVDHLTREQLQGVVAHEFGHILTGDLKLHTRITGVLHGILLFGLLGRRLLFASYNPNSRSIGVGMALGLLLMLLGSLGVYFGGLIKTAVSRQQEFLADAFAVQITRNPEGLTGALRRIGGITWRSRVRSRISPEFNHTFFTAVVSRFSLSSASTHPSLNERIRRIDPRWDGSFIETDLKDLAKDKQGDAMKNSATRDAFAKSLAAVATGAVITDVARLVDQIGEPEHDVIDYARSLIATLPDAIKQAVGEPDGARAIVFCLLLDPGGDSRARQTTYLNGLIDDDVSVFAQKLAPEMAALDVRYRLPIIDLAIPTLKRLTTREYRYFKNSIEALTGMAAEDEPLNWSIRRILSDHLDGHFFASRHMGRRTLKIGDVPRSSAALLSVLARTGNDDREAVKKAFESAKKIMGLDGIRLVKAESITSERLDRVVRILGRLDPAGKSTILRACAAAVLRDNKVTPHELELFRAIACALDCPIPPIVPAQAPG